MRTPLNAIIGMTELLLDTARDDEQQQFIETVLTNSEALLQQVSDVLDVSRIDAGELELLERTYDPLDVVEGTVDVIQLRAESKGLWLAVNVSHELPSNLVGDPHRLRQVLLNLVSNAVKFTNAGGIELSARLGGEKSLLVFEVRDSGIGIPEESQHFVFDPFTQVSSRTRDRVGGAGLGLNIARRLTQLMGGNLALVESSSSGSCFRIELPLRPDGDPEPRRDRGALVRGTAPRIMVVDPVPARRRALERVCISLGADVMGFSSLALAVARRNHLSSSPVMVIDEDAFLDEQLHELDPDTSVLRLVPIGSGAAAEEGEEVLARPSQRRRLLAALERLIYGVSDGLETSGFGIQQPLLSASSAAVLVVDDTDDSRRYLRLALERMGCDVHEAFDGHEAVKRVVSRRFDLVFMDLEMPTLDGAEAIVAIREHEQRHETPRTPIVVLSAHATAAHQQRCVLADSDAFVTKPIRREDLARSVDGYVDRRAVVLVVGDVPGLHVLIRHQLRPESYRVYGCFSADASMDFFARGRVDVVILDMELSVDDPYATATALRQVSPSVPVIALTTTAGRDERRRCVAAGCSTTLARPVRRANLMERLSAVLPPTVVRFDPAVVDAWLGAKGARMPARTPEPTPIDSALTVPERRVPEGYNRYREDPEMWALVLDYLRVRMRELPDISAAVDAEDHDTLRRLMHRNKGSSGMYGFEELHRLSLSFEEAATRGDIADTRSVYERWEACVERLSRALEVDLGTPA